MTVQLPEPKPRRPLDDTEAEHAKAGRVHYQESDRDYLMNNSELAVHLLDAYILRSLDEKSRTLAAWVEIHGAVLHCPCGHETDFTDSARQRFYSRAVAQCDCEPQRARSTEVSES